MDRHRQAVGKIAAAVKGYYARAEPYRIAHGSTNSTRPRPSTNLVDISALDNVLRVDRAAKTALVEPNVPMDKLVAATLAHGLVPPVVMEFPGITAGGGYAGTAGESSSFKHGYFDQTIREVEMVLGNGDVVRAGRDQRQDLFRGAAGALGTLGLTTAMELELHDAKTFVETTYHRTASVAEAVDTIRHETKNPDNDYVDGILFSKTHGVVVTGRMTDAKPPAAAPQTFSGAWDPWFYMHVHARTAALAPRASRTEHVPLAEYLFRYDRGGFWVAAAAFDYFKYVPFNRLTRWFLDDFLHTRMLYRALHASGQSARFVVQDLALPYASAEAFVDYAADEFGIWPLWLCPLKQTPPPTFHPFAKKPVAGQADPGAAATSAATAAPPDLADEDRECLNIGLWGWGPAHHDTFVAKNRALEHKLLALGGRKWLYAHTYYARDQFWDRVYPGTKPWYDALRAKYHAATLPTVHDKVAIDVDARRREREGTGRTWRDGWPWAGFYGIRKAIQSGDYFLHRNAKWKWKAGDDKA